MTTIASPLSMYVFMIAAGLMGAAGVTLAAAAAHTGSTVRLEPAGYLLLLHAPAVIAAALAADRGLLWRPLGLAALAGFLVGASLFAGDLSVRAFAGTRLFPMAAPAGGIVLIVGWLALGAAGLLAWLRA